MFLGLGDYDIAGGYSECQSRQTVGERSQTAVEQRTEGSTVRVALGFEELGRMCDQVTEVTQELPDISQSPPEIMWDRCDSRASASTDMTFLPPSPAVGTAETRGRPVRGVEAGRGRCLERTEKKGWPWGPSRMRRPAEPSRRLQE